MSRLSQFTLGEYVGMIECDLGLAPILGQGANKYSLEYGVPMIGRGSSINISIKYKIHNSGRLTILKEYFYSLSQHRHTIIMSCVTQSRNLWKHQNSSRPRRTVRREDRGSSRPRRTVRREDRGSSRPQ